MERAWEEDDACWVVSDVGEVESGRVLGERFNSGEPQVTVRLDKSLVTVTRYPRQVYLTEKQAKVRLAHKRVEAALIKEAETGTAFDKATKETQEAQKALRAALKEL